MLQTMKWVTSAKQLTNYNDSYTQTLTMKKLHSPKGVRLTKTTVKFYSNVLFRGRVTFFQIQK